VEVIRRGGGRGRDGRGGEDEEEGLNAYTGGRWEEFKFILILVDTGERECKMHRGQGV